MADLLEGTEPPPEERLTLVEAAQMFDPPKSKQAIERLVYRGRIMVWKQESAGGRRAAALWTTRPWLEEFSRSGPRAGKLREAGGAEGEENLRQMVAELTAENMRLRERAIAAEAALKRRGIAVPDTTARPPDESGEEIVELRAKLEEAERRIADMLEVMRTDSYVAEGERIGADAAARYAAEQREKAEDAERSKD